MKTPHAWLALTLWLTACMPLNTTAYPAPTTSTTAPAAAPTTPAPTETPPPTAITAPGVWEIWFSGFSCEFLAECWIGPGQEIYYYSIKSDGSDLTQLSISMLDFASNAVEIPNGEVPVHPGMQFFPIISPSGEQAIYFGEDRGLHILRITNREVDALYNADGIFLLGPFCWSADESKITFVEVQRGEVRQTPIVRQIDRNGQNPTSLYSLPGLERMWSGTCSPDGRQMVIAVDQADNGKEAGLFLLNLDDGRWQQLLDNYSVRQVRIAP